MTREQKLRSILMQDTIFTKEFYTKFYEDFYSLMQNPSKELDGEEVIDFRNKVAEYFKRDPYSDSWTHEYEDKLCTYENVIRCQLLKADVDTIDLYWSAFARNPVKFIGDNLIDLIADDLKLKGVKERRNKMRKLSNILENVSELDKMHYMEDGSLAYGKWSGKPVYVRRLATIPEAYGIDTSKVSKPFTEIVTGYSGNKDPLVTIWYSSDTQSAERGTIVFVFRLSDTKDLRINEFLVEPIDYEYYGTFLIGDEYDVSMETYITLASIYTPFADGPNGSKIPVMWRNDLEVKHFEDGRLPWRSTNSFDDYLDGDYIVFNREDFTHFNELLDTALPSVDLETEAEKRYAYIETKLDRDLCVNNVPVFVYNRNHVAHNGAIAKREKLSPVLFLFMSAFADAIEGETLTSYCMKGFENPADIVINRKISRAGNETPYGIPGEDEVAAAMEQSTEESLYEENPLLRAAKASDTRYK